jgi:hypothetical protein
MTYPVDPALRQPTRRVVYIDAEVMRAFEIRLIFGWRRIDSFQRLVADGLQA